MAGFGENLRREREMRGVSLQEISDTTKVSVRFLEALEAEQFAKLPGGIFIRSFIRAYANYLGLDEEQVLAEYQLVAPPKADEDFSRLGVTGNPSKRAPRAPVLPWIIAVVLLGAGYAIFRYSHRASDEVVSYGNPPPASAATAKRAAAAANTPPAEPPKVLAPAGTANPVPVSTTGAASSPPPASTTSSLEPVAVKNSVNTAGAAGTGAASNSGSPSTPAAASSTPSPAAQGGLVLQVAATQPAWVSVKADGKIVLERVLNPNDVRTLTAKASFDVVTGNAQATVLTLNGVTLKPLGGYGEVKTVHLTRDDVKTSGP